MSQAQILKTILFIEGSGNLANALRPKFRTNQMEVVACKDYPNEATTIMSTRTFDLILLHFSEFYNAERDWKILEEREGTKNATTPIIAIMTDYDDLIAERAKKLGVTRIFRIGDLSPEQLLETMRNQLAIG